jgi:hypothetical protein
MQALNGCERNRRILNAFPCRKASARRDEGYVAAAGAFERWIYLLPTHYERAPL